MSAWRRRRLTASVTVAALLIAAPAAFALPTTPQSSAWVTNGNVRAFAQSGDTTYIGGEFTYVGPRTGQAIRLAKSDASLQAFPEFAGGPVYALERDGSGGWYVGGGFTHVGGSPHPRLVHILPSGSVDPAFNPDPAGTVQDLALNPGGDELYAAGSFSSIGGQSQRLIAQLDPASGAASATWNPVLIGSSVNAVDVHVGGASFDYVYIGGSFSKIDTTAVDNFAELYSSTGALTGAVASGADGPVYDVEVDGNFVYVGGAFTTFVGATRSRLAALVFSTAMPSTWDPNITQSGGTFGSVRDIDASSAGHVHIAGDFDHVGADVRTRVAEIDDAASGSDNATAWSVTPTGNLDTFTTSVDMVAVDGSTVYVGGNFTSIGGAARNGLAAIDSSGSATSWNPNLSDTPRVAATDGTNVLVGGDFTAAKGVRRANVAALDADGVATAWNPGVGFNDTVRALAVAPSGSPIYIGGSFNDVGGATRHNLAAVDATGALTAWDPDADSDVNSLLVAPDGQTVYVGGQFSTIGGQARDNLAALSAAGGNATSWNPSPDGQVNAMLMKLDGVHLIVGGDFNNFGPTMRSYLAELDVGSNTPTSWAPEPDQKVHALALSPNGATVYLGGEFGNVGTQVRNNIAAVDAASGAVTGFDPDSSEKIFALAMSEDGATIFAGGEFRDDLTGTIGGTDRHGPVELDAATGAATGWDIEADDYVFALTRIGPDLQVGGDFERIGPTAQSGFARFVGPHPPPVPPPGPPPGPAPAPVLPSGPPADVIAPILSNVSMTRRRFAVGRKATPVTAAKRRVRKGTRFRWTLSEAATTRIAVKRELPGLRIGKRCRVATRSVKRRVNRLLAKKVRKLSGAKRAKRLKALLRKRRCTALKRRGALTRAGVQGPNSTAFSGRIGKKALAPGRYRAIFRATDAAGNRSTPKRLRFRVVRAPKRRR